MLRRSNQQIHPVSKNPLRHDHFDGNRIPKLVESWPLWDIILATEDPKMNIENVIYDLRLQLQCKRLRWEGRWTPENFQSALTMKTKNSDESLRNTTTACQKEGSAAQALAGAGRELDHINNTKVTHK